MGSVSTIRNQAIVIDLPTDFSDNGWIIADGSAIHSGCNSGDIYLANDILEPNTEYTVKYEVFNRTSGLVRSIVGGTNGTSRTANGTYTEVLTTDEDGSFKFYSDGNLSIRYLSINPTVEDTADNSITLAFNEKADKWVTYYSYSPELMCKFGNSFFTFKNARMWEHNVNPIRNNFYGVQYSSKITFYCNVNPQEIKTFFSLREKSNKVWSVPDIEILPREGKPLGQKSRLKEGRFKSLQGDWFGDFLRDLSDPRYTTELEALTKGAPLQGGIMKLTIENADTTEVRLLSVDVLFSKQSYTY
jgi:hypothetical protein